MFDNIKRLKQRIRKLERENEDLKWNLTYRCPKCTRNLDFLIEQPNNHNHAYEYWECAPCEVTVEIFKEKDDLEC